MKVVIVGGGPAGILAGISAAQESCDTIILEKMSNIRKKIEDNRKRKVQYN